MAWERRGNRQYYYESHRGPDGRVRKTYYGSGDVAKKAAEAAACRRREREAMLERLRQSATLRSITRAVSELTRSLVRAELESRGYHKHKGTWRKSRG